MARALSRLPQRRGLLTVGQVAEQLGWSADRVRSWIRQGKLPALRYGKRVYVAAAALAEVRDLP